LPKAVRWLLEQRRGAGWDNTQATAFAVLGLVDVIKATGELQSNYSYTVKLNGQTVGSGAVTPQSAAQVIPPITVNGQQLLAGVNRLTVERSSGTGSLYYTALLDQQLYYDGFTPVSSVDQGLGLTRSYRLAEGAPRSDGAYNVGDLVEVTLRVQNSQELWYVLISDPIPAGFEVVEEQMNQRSWQGYYDFFYWPIWGYNQKEARDDRVEYFITQLWQGSHTFTYLMRATTPGDFSVLPGTATPMYKAEIWGRSASQRVQVAPESLAARPTLAGDFDRSCRINAFDTQLTAAAFAGTDPQFDLNQDGQVDLRDVATVGSWQGSACGETRSLPGNGSGRAGFTVSSSGAIHVVGDEVHVAITLASVQAAEATATAPSGFALTLQTDPSYLAYQRLEQNPTLGGAIPLVATAQDGTVTVGLYGLPSSLSSDTTLATVVFRGNRVGASDIRVVSAMAVDNADRAIEATANGGGAVTIDGEAQWLPLVRR
jgi:hypothetical protein